MSKPLMLIKISVLIFVCVLVVSIPIAIIWAEPLSLKRSFDNPYINANYRGWKKQSINRFGEIMIPEGWTTTEDESIIKFADEDKHAIGWAIITTNNNYTEDPLYLKYICENCSPNPTFSFQTLSTGKQHAMDNSYYLSTKIQGEDTLCSYVTLVLKSSTNQILVISFLQGEKYSNQILEQWAEAIVYNYSFQ